MVNQDPFANPELISSYEDWYHTTGRRADIEEKSLLKWCLGHFQDAHSILEVGCGTGHFTRWLKQLGLQPYGLDRSSGMLAESRKNNGYPVVLGDAHNLPFSSKSIDLSVLITTLEFVGDPKRGLSEAWRISRQGIILGVINRHSALGLKNMRKGGSFWGSAHLFTPHELVRSLRDIVDENCRIVWRTTLWPCFSAELPIPWGGFIGLAAIFGSKGEGGHGSYQKQPQ